MDWVVIALIFGVLLMYMFRLIYYTPKGPFFFFLFRACLLGHGSRRSGIYQYSDHESQS